MARHTRVYLAAGIGPAAGAATGWLLGRLIGSDNVPFFLALGALAGMWVGLALARVRQPLAHGVLALATVLLVAVLSAPPRAPSPAPAPELTAVSAPAARAEGLTLDQVATLSSLRKVDDYPLYTMRYVGEMGEGETRRGGEGEVSETTRAFGCYLFAALGDPANRLFGRNFDWRYSPALLLFTGRSAAGGYASVSMVDIRQLGFGGTEDLMALPLAQRRGLLDAPSLPFDGMNEAGVAVGMAAVPQADARHDPGKPGIGSLGVIREVLDRAGSVDEAVAILKAYNIHWSDGTPLHYLVADRSGRAALVEFYGGEIAVLLGAGAWHAATNFVASAVAGNLAGQCFRYDTVVARLAAANGVLGPGEALGILGSVAQTVSATQWSVVYNMSTGQVDVVMGRDYARVHTFRLE